MGLKDRYVYIHQMKIRITGIELAYVNALRRAIQADIANVAIDEQSVVFTQNTTPLHNEFMSHRLSLVPFCVDLRELQSFSPDDYRFEINVTNAGAQARDVTSADITVNGGINRSFFPPSPITGDYILLTVLQPYQSLHATFRACKGYARDHARWSPVSNCVAFNAEDKQEVARQRKALLDTVGVDEARMNKFDTLDCQRIFHTNEHGGPDDFEFHIESECRLLDTDIFKLGLTALTDRLRRVATEPFEVLPLSEDGEGALFVATFRGESHTLGSVLQAYLHNTYIRKGASVIDNCGYYVPHPLEPSVVMKLRFSKGKRDAETAALFIKDALEKASDKIESLFEKILSTYINNK